LYPSLPTARRRGSSTRAGAGWRALGLGRAAADISSVSASAKNDMVHPESPSNPYDDAEPASPMPLCVEDSSVPRLSYLPPPPPLPRVQLLRRRLAYDPKSPSPYDEIPEGSEEEWEFFFALYDQFAETTLREQGRHRDDVVDADGESLDPDARTKRRNNYQQSTNRPPLILEEPSPGPLAHQSPLRNWIADQRKSYMKTIGILDLGARRSNWGTPYLLRSHKERLDEVGFAWGHIERRDLTDDELYSAEFRREVETKYKDWIWTPIYERLKSYKNDRGHTRVPLREPSGLGTWTAFQRTIRYQMPRRRRLKLESLGFDWDYRDPSEDGDWLDGLFRGNWTSPSLERQQEINDADGGSDGNSVEGSTVEDLPIPVEEVIARTAIPTQYRWTRQLGKDRTKSGNGNKFASSICITKTKSVPWSQRLKDLEAYKQKYGTVEVPVDYDESEVVANPNLGKWLKRTVRRSRKLSWKSRLALERLGVKL